MNKKLIVFDLDGTLVSNFEAGDIPKINLDIINKLKVLGHKIAIATGRDWTPMLKNICKQVDPINLITTNGSSIGYLDDKNNFKIQHSFEMNIDIIKEIISQDGPLSPLIETYTIPCSGSKRFFKDRKLRDIEHPYPEFYERYKTETFIIAIEHIEKPIGLYCVVDFKNKDKFIRLLKSKYRSAITYRVENFKDYVVLEIEPKLANKWNATKIVASYHNIAKEDIIAFGDGDNDMDLVTNAGLGYAMKNSTHEILKQKAHQITKHDNKSGGVGYALKDLFKLK